MGMKDQLTDMIEINPRVCHGRPVIRGTRMPVERVLGELAEGSDVLEICAQYDLSPEGVRAAVAFAARNYRPRQYVA